jgi:hypothetical protein
VEQLLMTKVELRRIFRQWEREEIENTEVIQALAKYLGEVAVHADPARGLTATEQRDQGGRCGCQGADDLCVCQNVPDATTRQAWRN